MRCGHFHPPPAPRRSHKCQTMLWSVCAFIVMHTSKKVLLVVFEGDVSRCKLRDSSYKIRNSSGNPQRPRRPCRYPTIAVISWIYWGYKPPWITYIHSGRGNLISFRDYNAIMLPRSNHPSCLLLASQLCLLPPPTPQQRMPRYSRRPDGCQGREMPARYRF